MVRTATKKPFCHVFINRNVKTKLFSCGHFYFIGCFSADKIKMAENRMLTERLRYENECLRAENALLKKVKALVEARDARLKEIGRKPSKN